VRRAGGRSLAGRRLFGRRPNADEPEQWCCPPKRASKSGCGLIA
jgi:hypothetical protein